MKLPSSSSRHVDPQVDRNTELIEFTRSIVDAARSEWGDRFVTDANAKGPPRVLYTETHYALAAVLLFLGGDRDRALLDLAAFRLRMWSNANGDKTFFNAMAYCLTAIVFRHSGEEHAGLRDVLADLLANTRENRHVGYGMNCGNNAYLQQVAVDTVLLPLARQERVSEEGVKCLVGEFRKYRTPEGFFYDLPRERATHEPLCPPTYIMKMLFLVGVCHELHPTPELANLFQSGMAAVLPLLSCAGHFSYFGRTDNSPFAAGLTIFNLRKAARIDLRGRSSYDEACIRAERYYKTFPRTSAGILRSNRFADATSERELDRSRDGYAYDGQYSLASCAYALLGCHWFPEAVDDEAVRSPKRAPGLSLATSRDLGLAKVRGRGLELVVRTGSELTSWDRRYLGPTILRYQVDGHLLVGAVSRTLSTDAAAATRRPATRLGRACAVFRRWFVAGIEQLDGTSVGFLPVLRQGSVDYLPYTLVALEESPSRLQMRYQMVQLRARGFRYCVVEAADLLRRRVIAPTPYRPPAMRLIDALELARDIYVEPERCRIEDRISGDLDGKTLLFSVRYKPGGSVRVRGLEKRRSLTGWGSDGWQTIDLYEAPRATSEIWYECDIELAAHFSH